MPNRFLLILLNIIFYAGAIAAQDYNKRFKPLMAAKDTASLRPLLKEWWENEPNDPEVFAAYFNYYVLKSTKETSGKTQYDPAWLTKAYWYADKGIAAFPNRLDLRFGKIYLLGETKNYKDYVDEIVKTIERSVKNKNAWLWTNNVRQAAPNDFMLTNIAEYTRLLINAGTNEQVEDAVKICELILKYNANHGETLVNLASCYVIKKQDEKAIGLLLKAEEINYEDISALSKLAEIYKAKGETKKALDYYDKIIRFGDQAEKQQARKEVEVLKK